MQYICNSCSKHHTTKVIEKLPLTFECVDVNLTKEFCRSWNTPSNKYCSRCVRYITGPTNRFCLYCNHCNTYLVEYLDSTKSISYNVNETTRNGRTFVFVSIVIVYGCIMVSKSVVVLTFCKCF